ncbi:D-hexose-6-phosphate mutarotase [Luteolibacter marinus]|uniref:D-hexose-6-phosphate mutarotase n=1 Tax=Luteolibacter marinus TaxID=2776705 RepID=UPI0018682444|nr:D-hexose-6-phosphate mutarotase [Luteolibacter marinus]
MNLPSSVRLVDLVPGYPVLEVDHPRCRGRVALHGAHVMDWQPAGEDPVLYLSPDAVFREGKAIRGGIPVCWPWFNAHPSDPKQPAHGIARSRFWQLDDTTGDNDGVELRFSLVDLPWAAALTVRMGRTLEVSLESTNPGEHPVAVSGALHSYLRVADVGEILIEGLDGVEYLDTVGEAAVKGQAGDLRIDREVDRIYRSTQSVRMIDKVAGRSVVVEKDGSPSTVVWNPWVAKAAALGDLPDDGFRHFVCIEAAIANDLAVVLGPKKSAVLRTTLRVER